MLRQVFDLHLVVFLSICQNQIGFQSKDLVNLDVFGSSNARDGVKFGFWSDTIFGLSNDIDVEVVQELSPTRYQGNDAHDAKLVRYLCVMKAPLRFAVVGCGHIGKRHVAMIQGDSRGELVAVIDLAWSSEGRGEVPARKWASEARAFTSLSDALNVLNFDVVSVATPNGSHVELACEAVAAGCHVVLEKPMGLTSKSIENLKKLAEEAGVKVFGVMQNRYAPAAAWLKSAHEAREFGELLQVHVQCLWNRDERYYQQGSWRGTMEEDGGPLFTQFSHFLDILLWVFGPVEVEDVHFYNQVHPYTEFEDGGLVRFRLEQGGWGTFTFSTAAPHSNFESSMTVLGRSGTVRIGGQYMNRLEEFQLPESNRPDLQQPPPPNDYGGYTGSAANHHHVYDNVFNVLLGGDDVATSIEEGLAVVRVVEEIHAKGRI